MKKPTDKYGFSDDVVSIIKPIIEAVEHTMILEAERKISQLALEVCDKIEHEVLSPKKANDCFLLVDLYKTDHFPDFKFRKQVEDIMFEGLILHDYGKDYGADLSIMRTLGKQILASDGVKD